MLLKKYILDKINMIEIVNNDEILEINLSDVEFTFIKKQIIKNPIVFEIIENKINSIFINNKIYIFDVPIVINLISEIYYSNILDDTMDENNIINITLFTFNVMIEFKLLGYVENDDSIYVPIYVSKSNNLSRINKSIKKIRKRFFFYIARIFINIIDK